MSWAHPYTTLAHAPVHRTRTPHPYPRAPATKLAGAATATTMSTEEQKIIKTLEEDDEFEDFPEDAGWTAQPNAALNSANLWEEDWDDEDGNDDFTVMLKEELRKAQKSQ